MSLQALKQVLNSENLVAEANSGKRDVTANNPSATFRCFQVRDLLAGLILEHLVPTVSAPFVNKRRARL
jgi:hypothetical protein